MKTVPSETGRSAHGTECFERRRGRRKPADPQFAVPAIGRD